MRLAENDVDYKQIPLTNSQSHHQMEPKNQTPSAQDQLLEKFIRESRQVKQARDEQALPGHSSVVELNEQTVVLSPSIPTSRTFRWVAGGIAGGFAGLSLALASQIFGYINLRNVPLYLPPFGSLFNIFLITMIGALFGLACAVSAGSVKKLGWACLAGAVLTEGYFLLSNGVGI